MHELSIASAVVASVLEFLDKHGAQKVLTVRLWVGELSHIEEEQLRFCYMAITRETAMEDSTLEIEHIPAVCNLLSQGPPSYQCINEESCESASEVA